MARTCKVGMIMPDSEDSGSVNLMKRLEVAVAQTIGAEPGLVRRQFGDVAHHESTALHRGVRFEVLTDDAEACHYRQVTTVGPLRFAQEFELARTSSGPLVNTITKGQFSGGAISFLVSPTSEPGQAEVVASISAPLRGPERLLGPLLRRKVIRALSAALDEDRVDLESGSYPA